MNVKPHSPEVLPSVSTVEQQRPLLDEEGLFYPHDHVFKGVAHIADTDVDFRIQTPDTLIDNHPIIIVNGYLGKAFGYSNLRDQLSKQGRVAVSVNPPRRQGLLSTYHYSCMTDPIKLLSQGIHGVVKTLRSEYNDLTDASQVDLVTHSMGLLVGTRFAQEHPGTVRNVVNVEGAGIENRPHPLRFVPRIKRFTQQELPAFVRGIADGTYNLGHDNFQAFQSEAHYMLANVPRTIAEGLYVSSHDVRKPLGQLITQQHIQIGTILGGNDTLIPAHITQRDGKGLSVHTQVMDFGHVAPMTHAAEVAEASVEFLHRAA